MSNLIYSLIPLAILIMYAYYLVTGTKSLIALKKWTCIVYIVCFYVFSSFLFYYVLLLPHKESKMLYDGIIMIIAIEMFCSLGFIKAIAVSYEEGLSLKDCGYFKSENKRKRRIGMFLVLITIIAWFLGLQFSEYIAVELVCFLLFVGGAVSSINLLISGTRLDKNLQ